MLTDEERRLWDDQGYYMTEGFDHDGIGLRIEAELTAAIEQDPPARHPGEPGYVTAEGFVIQPESRPMADAHVATDHVSKLFNAHMRGAARVFAGDARIVHRVEEVLDGPVGCFQSQFILKNPTAWGQPWHQDRHYFPFDKAPQVTVWLAISDATVENGCLSVLPGSHRDPIHAHVPDRRPGANFGSLEIVDRDATTETVMPMRAGDLLVFHSHLMHRSTDNVCDRRRSAIVLHYGLLGSSYVKPPSPAQVLINHWLPTPGARVAHGS